MFFFKRSFRFINISINQLIWVISIAIFSLSDIKFHFGLVKCQSYLFSYKSQLVSRLFKSKYFVNPDASCNPTCQIARYVADVVLFKGCSFFFHKLKLKRDIAGSLVMLWQKN